MQGTNWMIHRVLPKKAIVDPNAYWERGTLITTQKIEELLSQALTKGYRFHLFTDWHSLQVAQTATRYDLTLTIDDGYLDNYVHLLPILERLGIKATFFPILKYCLEGQQSPLDAYYHWVDDHVREPLARQGWITGPQKHQFLALQPEAQATWVAELYQKHPCASTASTSYMSTDQLRDLLNLGHELGGHSWQHPLLPTLSPVALSQELVQTRLGLDALGVPVNGRSFAYPDGQYNTTVIEALKKEGYSCACTVAEPPTTTYQPYASPRAFVTMTYQIAE